MNANGHFASVGQNGKADFEHGLQVIDEDKEFKYAANESFPGESRDKLISFFFLK